MTTYTVTTYNNGGDSGTKQTTNNKAEALKLARAHVEGGYIDQAAATVHAEGAKPYEYVARYVNQGGKAVKVN